MSDLDSSHFYFPTAWTAVEDERDPADRVALLEDRDRALEDWLRRLKVTGGAGPPGPPGSTIITGSGAPTSATGSTGDYYIDTVTDTMYGPKAADGSWPVALVGGGAGGPANYVHDQMTAAAVWTVNHNLGFYPNVRVEDSGGSDVEGDVTYTSTSQLTLSFSAAFSGKAYLS